jgi:hypothetical protein
VGRRCLQGLSRWKSVKSSSSDATGGESTNALLVAMVIGLKNIEGSKETLAGRKMDVESVIVLEVGSIVPVVPIQGRIVPPGLGASPQHFCPALCRVNSRYVEHSSVSNLPIVKYKRTCSRIPHASPSPSSNDESVLHTKGQPLLTNRHSKRQT